MSENINQNTSGNCDETDEKKVSTKKSEKAVSKKSDLVEAEGLSYSVNEDGISCTVTGIGSCKKKKLYIPRKIVGYDVTDIGKNAFGGRKNLLSVHIPEGVKTIGDGAFNGCVNMAGVRIPLSVNHIGKASFRNCATLLTVTYNGAQEAWSGIRIDPDWIEDSASAEIKFSESENCHHVAQTIPAIAPTCTDHGSTEGQRCSLCGEVLIAPLQIPKSDHVYGEWTVTKEATCNTSGTKERICSCGKKQTKTVKATGHRFGEWTVVKKASCIEDGLEERVCVCGAKETRAVASGKEHRFGAWRLTKDVTCTEGGICERVCDCGARETLHIEARGHRFGEWTVVKQPSCTENGLEERICGCGAKETRHTEPWGHRFGEWTVAKAPSCVEEGLEERVCDCGARETRKIPITENHVASDWIVVKEPTVGKGGLREIRCLLCGKTLKEEQIAPLASPKLDYVVASNGKTCKITGFGSCEKDVLTIPEQIDGYKVTEIGRGAFDFCESLRSAVIPASVTHIGESAFEGCISLTSVTIPASVKNIGWRAFCGCRCLETVSIAATVESIGDYAFTNCELLTEVILPDSLTGIAWKVFYGCKNLSRIVIPSSVKEIKYLALGGCGKLSSIIYKGTQEQWKKIDIHPEWKTNAEVPVIFEVSPDEKTPESVSEAQSPSNVNQLSSTGINYSVNPDGKTCTITGVGSCKSAKILLPWTIDGYTVTAVADQAFRGCTTVTEITVWGSVTEIGNEAFCDCAALSRVNIGKGVKSIGDMAFYGCDRLSKILIPPTVVKIGKMAFSCGAENINVANENPAFSSVDGNLCSKDKQTLLQYALGKAETDIHLSPNITKIGDFAFANCATLSRVNLHDGITAVGTGAFYGCAHLASLTLGVGLTDIEAFAFGKCPEISHLVIPDSVRAIGDQAFGGCAKLSEIQFNGTQEQWNAIALSKQWSENSSIVQINLQAPLPTPPGAKPATGSGKLAYMRYRDNKTCAVTGIGDCTDAELVIPRMIDGYEVKIILFYAFQNLRELTSVVIPDGVTEIRNSAFKNCISLQKVVIPAGVTKIEASVFEGCTQLSEIIYLGTKEQWQRIHLHHNWNRNSDIRRIRCSDS